MVSGMYMGEIVRLVLCHLCAQGILFNGEGSEELLLPNRFLTKYISEIERLVYCTRNEMTKWDLDIIHEPEI